MEQFQENLKKLIELMGFDDFSVNYDDTSSRFSIFINNGLVDKFLPSLVENIDHLAKLIAKQKNIESVFVDINNYRKKREDLIIELAKASARKSLAEKKEILLPPMNAYERRIVHMELAHNPDIKTESTGEGKERYIVIRPIS